MAELGPWPIWGGGGGVRRLRVGGIICVCVSIGIGLLLLSLGVGRVGEVRLDNGDDLGELGE